MDNKVHLFQKVAETIPGKRSLELREIHYQHSDKLGETMAKALMDCANYLEGLAIAEIKAQIPPWVSEVNER